MIFDDPWDKDAQQCEYCGGDLDDENDCLQCGEHSMTDYEREEAAAERRYEEWKDERHTI